MEVILAKHYGMCFGVRDALRATHNAAENGPLTVLGELVHNQVVHEQLDRLGVRRGDLWQVGSSKTKDVVVTAHGAAERDRQAWKDQGYRLVDTTCPLVRKAHASLELLVTSGYHPVVIGKRDHVEVRGLTGDFPEASVLLDFTDLDSLPLKSRYGVISQTTQPLAKVRQLVEAIQQRFPDSEVRFIDTVCQPTKDRQKALAELCASVEVVVVVGGANSNNTHELVKTARGYGARAYHVSRAAEVEGRWFKGQKSVGVTAGTSTLDETVEEVCQVLRAL